MNCAARFGPAQWIAAAIGIFVMGWIVYTVFTRGIGAWNLAFFTQLPPVGNDPGGGLANAIVGPVQPERGAECGRRRGRKRRRSCIGDMFILTDQWGKIRRFNRAVETFTGKAHRDIVGRG